MPFNAVLGAVIDQLNATGSVAYIGWRTAQDWPVRALDTLIKVGLLVTAPAAKSLQCDGCENQCFMDVIVLANEANSGKRVFIVCDHPNMQSQMGRMAVPLEQLQQWKTNPGQFAGVISRLLRLDNKHAHSANESIFKLGMIKGDKGRRWVSLITNPLRLEVNGYNTPLDEILYFDGDSLQIDQPGIEDCMNRVSAKESKSYVTSTDKREAGKLKTLAMYQDWRDEYQRLLKIKPGMGDIWYSKQIKKMDIAQGRSAGRIRKMMKV